MYAGLIVEVASASRLYANPKHPYTRALLQTLPDWGEQRSERLFSIRGQPPSLNEHPRSCPFAPRCDYVRDQCLKQNPVLESQSELAGDQHLVACWLSASEVQSMEVNND